MVIRTLVIVLCMAAAVAAAEDDIAALRARLIGSILPTDPTAQKELLGAARRHATALREDGAWPDLDYADQARTQWQPQQHLSRVLLMSRAFRLSGDETLRARINSALDHWLAHDYRSPNWWQNEIGAPQLLAQSVLLLQPHVTPLQLERSLTKIRRANWKNWTGQNLVWGVTIQVLRGLIENDAAAITQAYDRLHAELRITTSEGIQPDFSFHQHGVQFYSGGYGLVFAQDVPRYVSFAWGTRWQISDEQLTVLTHFLLDGQQWMMRGGRFDYSAVGRQIARKNDTAAPRSWTSGPVVPVGAAYGLPNAVTLLAQHPIPRRDELWRSDYMAHQRPGWFASVRMFSKRVINTELVNDEGKKSQHLADGCSFLYLDGDEYLDIFPAWDWTMIPGTTAEAVLEVEKPQSIRVLGKTSFVGGVSDGEFGLAAMHLSRGSLAARKAWFFFDDGYLCMGAEITCSSENAVATTINQCLDRSDVLRGDGWVHHGGVGYVVPRDGLRLTTNEQGGRWSDIGVGASDVVRRKIFKLWIDHGMKPSGATYEYVVLPGATPSATAEAAAKSPARILRNTPQVQAAFHAASKTLACVFAEAGDVASDGQGVAVDQPCLLLMRRGNLTLSNPENAPLTVNVRIGDRSIRVELPGGDAAGSSRTIALGN